MTTRRPGGRETWHRLLEWDQSSTDSERLAAGILSASNFEDIDPSHPLGGPDGGKDLVCTKDGLKYVAACFFPRGQKTIAIVKEKFLSDLANATGQAAQGFIFLTNQELTLSQRAGLEDAASPLPTEIFHLERIASCLDRPSGYALRLEFLSIEMTKEEQLAFINDQSELLRDLRLGLARLPSPLRTENETQKSAGIQDAYVTPLRQEYGYYTASSIYPHSKLMECIDCREVFRAVLGHSVTTFNLSSEIKAVTCPRCGKVQAYR